MKNIYLYLIIGALCFGVPACELDLSNPNAATETDVLTTKDGLFALAIGIRQVYSTSALGSAILTPSVTTRETAITTTFANLEELEEGGTKLPGENGYTSRLFSRLYRVKGMSEDLINNVGNVTLDAGTSSALSAWGKLFRAMCLGHLAQNFEQVAITNSRDNMATYFDRTEAYAEAIQELESALSGISSNPVSSEFTSSVSSEIDLENSCWAMLSRYRLFAGDYAGAIEAANNVDRSSMSVFSFDPMNQNDVFADMNIGTVSYAPRDNFGLDAAGLTIDDGDMRKDFWVAPSDELSLNNLPIDVMIAPFFSGVDSPIPVYVPGEVLLNAAEAQARSGNTTQAEILLNQVRNKMPSDDVFGLGAGLTDTYTSGGDVDALLEEIFKNRRIELYLTGVSLEDSRRFNRPEPPANTDFSSERNRNFYPYPAGERLTNPNTPPDPSI